MALSTATSTRVDDLIQEGFEAVIANGKVLSDDIVALCSANSQATICLWYDYQSRATRASYQPFERSPFEVLALSLDREATEELFQFIVGHPGHANVLRLALDENPSLILPARVDADSAYLILLASGRKLHKRLSEANQEQVDSPEFKEAAIKLLVEDNQLFFDLQQQFGWPCLAWEDEIIYKIMEIGYNPGWRRDDRFRDFIKLAIERLGHDAVRLHIIKILNHTVQLGSSPSNISDHLLTVEGLKPLMQEPAVIDLLMDRERYRWADVTPAEIGHIYSLKGYREHIINNLVDNLGPEHHPKLIDWIDYGVERFGRSETATVLYTELSQSRLDGACIKGIVNSIAQSALGDTLAGVMQLGRSTFGIKVYAAGIGFSTDESLKRELPMAVLMPELKDVLTYAENDRLVVGIDYKHHLLALAESLGKSVPLLNLIQDGTIPVVNPLDIKLSEHLAIQKSLIDKGEVSPPAT